MKLEHSQLLVRRPNSGMLPAMRNFLFSCLLGLVMPAIGAEINIDFGDIENSQAPTNFHGELAGTGQPGTWAIVSAPTPPTLAPLSEQAPMVTSRPVLAQTSQDSTDERFPIYVYDGQTFRDFKLTTRFEIIGGVAEQMAGLVFRFQNSSNFYVIRASALGHNVRFYKMVDGVRSDPIGPQVDVTTNVWHELTVQCKGNQMIFLYDHQLLMPPLNDNTFAGGKVGFWTKSDAVSYFRDLTIDYAPQISAAQALVNSIVQKQSRLLGLRIYVLNNQGQPYVLASKEAGENGQAGGNAEKTAITDGKVSVGRGPGTVAVWLPFRDRNGDPMAAIWVRLKTFFGETQENAVTRGTYIVKDMQQDIMSTEDLMK
jgi:hypothetical protein